MPVVVISPPDEPVVSLEDAKAHLRVDFEDDDDYISGLVAAAIGILDGPAGWLGRAIVTQTLELRSDGFGVGDICLPFPPIVDVVSVGYVDTDGSEQMVPEADYRLVGQPNMPRLELVYGAQWPAVRWQSESVRVQYDAGYGAAEDVPAPIKQAILLMIGHWYANREAVAIGQTAIEIPLAARALLFPYQILA